MPGSATDGRALPCVSEHDEGGTVGGMGGVPASMADLTTLSDLEPSGRVVSALDEGQG